jgi:peptidyl-prolyl cis-trans isomerase B (cyclophilin B)
MGRMHLGAVGVFMLVSALAGCGSNTPEAASPEAPAVPAVPAKATPQASPGNPEAPPRDVLHQSFHDATTAETPAGEFLPVDKLANGKISGKLYEAIVGRNGQPGLWDQIHFTSRDGRPLQYTVTLKTDLGEIVIELWPDAAPNHVRNFLALCQVGYYDGMTFHQTVKHPDVNFIEAGCPLGTGAPGYGHIGYWLKRQLQNPDAMPKIRHDEGTLGAFPASQDLETTACKFYITLSKYQGWDGENVVFGKVTRGLDVARKILEQPRSTDDPNRPENPVVIRTATVQSN